MRAWLVLAVLRRAAASAHGVSVWSAFRRIPVQIPGGSGAASFCPKSRASHCQWPSARGKNRSKAA
jgi:hypothetical protein